MAFVLEEKTAAQAAGFDLRSRHQDDLWAEIARVWACCALGVAIDTCVVNLIEFGGGSRALQS